jgi:hypothetical protein
MRKDTVIAAIIGFIVGWLTAGSVIRIVNLDRTRKDSWSEAWRNSASPVNLHPMGDGREDDFKL